MGDHDYQSTCVSAEPHETAIRDYLQHFLGCLEFRERIHFFSRQNPIWQTDTELAIRPEANNLTPNKRWDSFQACLDQLRRIEYLRKAVGRDDDNLLIPKLTQSKSTWKASGDYQAGLAAIKKWKETPEYRVSLRPVNTWGGLSDPQAKSPTAAELEYASWDYFLGMHVDSGISSNGGIQASGSAANVSTTAGSDIEARDHYTTRASDDEDSEEYDPEKDLNAYMVQFEQDGNHSYHRTEERDANIRSLRGHFPDQRMSVAALLGETQKEEDGTKESARKTVKYDKPDVNFLGNERDEGHQRIRWFHLPANNMAWAERAIALYYGEEVPDYDGIHRELEGSQKTSAYMILRPQYWRGQLHGGRNDVIHARHMRPLSEIVSSNPTKIEDNPASPPNNVVLFMPYLHWETDRNRNAFSEYIDKVTLQQKKDNKEYHNKLKRQRQKFRLNIQRFMDAPTDTTETTEQVEESNTQERSEIIKTTGMSVLGHLGWARKRPQQRQMLKNKLKALRTNQSRAATFRSVVLGLGKQRLEVENGRVLTKSPLGQYLIDAARLYEAMSNYRDKKLVGKYLHIDPPFHPRRTLDQAYYWSLSTTSSRDRDQVVYRGTRAAASQLHQYDIEKKCWPVHKELDIKDNECITCRSNIRQVPRLVMVDQLWMWILDKRTIITLFPKRYGANKNDGSGVHRSIRARLKTTQKNQIRSVFDLALIIIDECSNTFFDRTKTPDRQPQVLDLFAEAIGNITHRQTAAFEKLWLWTERAKSIYRSKTKSDTSDLHVALLDINPEGKLQREIKDIIEELDIMIYINKTHLEVLTNFMAQVKTLLDPQEKFSHRSDTFTHDGSHSTTESLGQGGPQRPMTSSSTKSPASTEPSQQETPHMGSEERQWREYRRFKQDSDDLRMKMERRLEELQQLKENAESTSNSVKDLLGLKQQQAGVVQAWQSVKEAEESLGQGRAIMMFTIVTIVFAPLGFVSSVFGMNAVELNGGTLSLLDEFKYIIWISAIVIAISLTLAFGTWIRSLIWSGYRVVGMALMVWLPMPSLSFYKLWMRMNVGGFKLRKEATDKSEKMAERATKEEFKRRAELWIQGEEKIGRNKKGASLGTGHGSSMTVEGVGSDVRSQTGSRIKYSHHKGENGSGKLGGLFGRAKRIHELPI